MPSLMECILENANTDEDPDEFLDSFSIDRLAVSSVEGGWERVNTNSLHPEADGLDPSDFDPKQEPVYEVNGYVIVRGFDGARYHWFLAEKVGIHSY